MCKGIVARYEKLHKCSLPSEPYICILVSLFAHMVCRSTGSQNKGKKKKKKIHQTLYINLLVHFNKKIWHKEKITLA